MARDPWPAAVLAAAVLPFLGCASAPDEPARPPRLAPPPPRDELPAAPGAAALPELADLDAYVALALASSARLRAAFEDQAAAHERVAQASALPDPRLTYAEFIEEVQTRTGPQERRVSLAQMFPWPGTLDARGRAAEHRAAAAAERADDEALRVARDVALAYHEYAFLGRELDLAREQLELLRGLEPVVRARVRAGGVQEDLLRLQVEAGRLEDDVASLERRAPALSAVLADALTLRGLDAPLPVPLLTVPEAPELDVANLRARALETSPRLRALRAEALAHEATEELAELRARPELGVGVDWISTGDALDPSMPGSGDDPLAVSLTLSLPVWTDSYAAGEREARHRSRASRQRLEAEASALEAEVAEHAYRIDDAARRIGLYRDSLVPRADEALQLTLASYRAGAASLLDVIDAERALLELALSSWRACRDLLQAEARLGALVGGDV